MNSLLRLAVRDALLLALVATGSATSLASAQSQNATDPQTSSGPQTSANSADAATSPSITPPTSESQLEQVTVTANRVKQNLQNVPIAVSTLSGEQMKAIGVNNLTQLGESVPGAVFNRQSNGSIPFIRGVGNPNSTSGDEPSVATYVDGVYQPFPGAGVANYNSIDHIEIDKGPQGTLFGRNATGGVIQVQTKDPTPQPELDLTAGLANYDTYSSSMYGTSQLATNLSGNVAAYWSHQVAGWGHNVVTGDPAFTDHYEGGRTKLLWTPADQTQVLLDLDFDETVSDQGLDYRGAPGTETVGGFLAPTGYFDYYSPVDDRSIFSTRGISLQLRQGLGFARLVNILAYRYSENPAFYNLDLGPSGPGFVPVFITGKDHTLTEEARLESVGESNLRWTAGFFYFGDTAKYEPLNLNLATPGEGPDFNDVGVQYTKSYALYADSTYTFVPSTDVTAGVRGTASHREAWADVTAPGIPAPPGTFGGGYGSDDFKSITGRFIVTHRFTQDFMAYVSYNRGYKDGLFNLVSIGSPIGEVKPETLDDISVGEKSEFLDHRLRLNAEAFYYKYKNIQVQEVVKDTSIATNAAAATMKGLDVDLTMVPVDRLNVTASLEYLDGKFTDFPNGAYNVYQPVGGGDCTLAPGNACGLSPGSPYLPPNYNPTTGTWNLKGTRTPNSPRFSSSLNMYYTIPTGIGPLDVNFAWHHSTTYYFQADNGLGQQPPSSQALASQPTLDLIDGSVGWTSPNAQWQLRIWGKNLTNVYYSDFSFETAPATQISGAPPRTYGITVAYHFE